MNLKIRFVKVPKPRQCAEGQTFKVGQVIDLPYASAQHWLTRNVAVVVVEGEAAKKVEQVTKPEEAEAGLLKRRGRPPKEA